MTLEEKIQTLTNQMMNANVLRFIMKAKISQIVAILPEDQVDIHLDMINQYIQTPEFRLEDAINFGSKLMSEFTNENINMGVTQDGMTKAVRKALTEIIMCLITGSLYDAIDEVKHIPTDKKDGKYLTNARLTVFINKIETYLGLPHTTVVDI